VEKTIGAVLRAIYDATASEPLPERWIDLINRLKEEELTHREGSQVQTRPPPKQD
jgi:hypothetical protein